MIRKLLNAADDLAYILRWAKFALFILFCLWCEYGFWFDPRPM